VKIRGRPLSKIVYVLVGLMIWLSFWQVASADNGTHRAGPTQDACPVGKWGHQLERSPLGDCVDNTPASPEAEKISAAKEAAAEAFAVSKSDEKARGDLDAVLNKLEMLTSEEIRSTTVGDGFQTLGYVGVNSRAQVNSYYCGPATAETILWYLGPGTSSSYDTVTGAYDSFNYSDSHDQGLMANYFWLATDNYSQTYWGDPYMPFTLNGWHGGGWYESAASSGLTSLSAWNDVDFDTNHGHPVAENVVYGSSTYFPAGFSSGTTYYHWDVIYATNSPAQSSVGIAEPWPYPGAGTRTAYQTQSWSNVWDAISSWHGIVW
jgi:hypothetical protein